jgi:hypothetical protein
MRDMTPLRVARKLRILLAHATLPSNVQIPLLLSSCPPLSSSPTSSLPPHSVVEAQEMFEAWHKGKPTDVKPCPKCKGYIEKNQGCNVCYRVAYFSATDKCFLEPHHNLYIFFITFIYFL